MKVLVGCEYSGVVSQAFLKKGHDVTSCDILPSESLGHKHYQGNILDIIDYHWDLIIAHPPCTYLCNAGQNWINREPGRKDKMYEAIEFVKRIYNSNCKHICIENPKGVLSRLFCPPAQIVYPFYFGDPYRKDICLWLKNLPPLLSTIYSSKRKSMHNHVNGRMSQAEKSKIKSKFFPGVAAAMADQWNEKYLF